MADFTPRPRYRYHGPISPVNPLEGNRGPVESLVGKLIERGTISPETGQQIMESGGGGVDRLADVIANLGGGAADRVLGTGGLFLQGIRNRLSPEEELINDALEGLSETDRPRDFSPDSRADLFGNLGKVRSHTFPEVTRQNALVGVEDLEISRTDPRFADVADSIQARFEKARPEAPEEITTAERLAAALGGIAAGASQGRNLGQALALGGAQSLANVGNIMAEERERQELFKQQISDFEAQGARLEADLLALRLDDENRKTGLALEQRNQNTALALQHTRSLQPIVTTVPGGVEITRLTSEGIVSSTITTDMVGPMLDLMEAQLSLGGSKIQAVFNGELEAIERGTLDPMLLPIIQQGNTLMMGGNLEFRNKMYELAWNSLKDEFAQLEGSDVTRFNQLVTEDPETAQKLLRDRAFTFAYGSVARSVSADPNVRNNAVPDPKPLSNEERGVLDGLTGGFMGALPGAGVIDLFR